MSVLQDSLSNITDVLGENKDLAYTLAAAGLAGAGGGYLSSKAEDPLESKGDRMRRILKNTLLSAGMGGGAMALGRYGMGQLNTSRPSGDLTPLQSAATPGGFLASLGLAAGANQGLREFEMARARNVLGEKLDIPGAGFNTKGKKVYTKDMMNAHMRNPDLRMRSAINAAEGSMGPEQFNDLRLRAGAGAHGYGKDRLSGKDFEHTFKRRMGIEQHTNLGNSPIAKRLSPKFLSKLKKIPGINKYMLLNALMMAPTVMGGASRANSFRQDLFAPSN